MALDKSSCYKEEEILDHPSHPPPQRKREEGTREASGKRRCVREDDKKGYCEDVRIPFLNMLYRKSSPNKFHGNHILRRVREG